LIINNYLGIGDWGLGIGDWGLGVGPNPQSPIPKNLYNITKFFFVIYNNNYYFILIIKF